MPPTTAPQTEDEWTIHSLNIHGEFLERWCAQVVRHTSPWQLVTTNYPVAADGHQSTLDVRADATFNGRRIILLMECKKNNPDFINWVFFRKHQHGIHVVMPHVTSLADLILKEKIFGSLPRVPIADVGRETRGEYLTYSKQKQDKTKTSNTAITDAAKQISLATHYIWNEERALIQRLLQDSSAYQGETTIVPMIVTSAPLHLCEFQAEHVDEQTGEIPLSRATLVNPGPLLVYEYPLPTYLQFRSPNDPYASRELSIRRHIVIVQTSNLALFLNAYAADMATP